MAIYEIKVSDPITSYEGQPDGGEVPIIDPYNGCELCCPYCFQYGGNWNKDIYIHLNIADILKDKLTSWNKKDEIYIGSKCDPYMPIEEKYGLTRKILAALSNLNINTMIATKSDNNLILRDLDILAAFNAEMTVLMGMSNINQISKGGLNNNITVANKLHDNGVVVWAFITPFLPFIMDAENIINKLTPNIPVFFDKLRVGKDTIQADNMKRFISSQYPEYIQQYEEIINNNNEKYYDVLASRYADNNRIKILFAEE